MILYEAWEMNKMSKDAVMGTIWIVTKSLVFFKRIFPYLKFCSVKNSTF